MTPTAAELLSGLVTMVSDSVEVRLAGQPNRVRLSVGDGRHEAAVWTTGRRRPGVLILHTAFGLTAHERSLAVRLMRAGLTAMVVPYSGRTTGAIVRDETACRDIDGIVSAAFDHLRSRDDVHGDCVSVLGLSLGGHFGIRLAARVNGPAPAAVVVWSGVYGETIPVIDALRSPLLIIQGADDSPAFVDAAREASVRAPDRVELMLCEGAGHQFDLFRPRSNAARAAFGSTLEVLTAHRGQPQRCL